jgi:phage terminase large subunit GpA
MSEFEWLDRVWRERFTPPDEREIWEFIAEEGELPSVYAVDGKLDIETAPMIKEPLRALRNPTKRNVICMCAVQTLKTLIGECWLVWLIKNAPGPTQWLQPDDQEAKEHAMERFLPLLEKFPIVHQLYTGNRHDKQTVFIKFINDMYLRMEGASNPGNRQRKSIMNQMCSEVWQVKKWKPGTLKEAAGRLTQYVHNSKRYIESQPGDDAELQTDDMHAEYLTGDQNVWEFACLKCGEYQPYHFHYFRPDGTRAGIRWDTNERTRHANGQWRETELLPTIRMECIYCGHPHYDDAQTRRRMAANGRHKPQRTDADPATVSYNWNQWAMPQLPWWETKIGGVKNFLLAHEQAKRGDERALKEFYQKVCGEPYHPHKHGVFARLETIEVQTSAADKAKAIVVQGITFEVRMMAVDVQADHFWVVVQIWSLNGDSLTLWAGKCAGWDDVRARQEEFQVEDKDVCVDVQHRRHEVIENCTRFGNWVNDPRTGRKAWVCWKALQGSDQDNFEWRPRTGPKKGQRVQLPYQWPPETGDPTHGLDPSNPKLLEYFKEFKGKVCQVMMWSNPWIKDVVIARRDGRARGVVCLVARGDWNAEFSRQMHSQKKVLAQGKYGGGKWKYEKFRDDHIFDAVCMIHVRAFQRHLVRPTAEKVVELTQAATETKPAPAPEEAAAT